MKVHVLDIGKNIATKDFQKKNQLKVLLKEPLIISAGQQKWVVILRYGVVAFWNMTPKEEKEWLRTIQPFVVDRFEKPLEDVLMVTKSSRLEGSYKDRIYLKSIDPQKIAIVSLILGRSLALERYERDASKTLIEFDSVMKSFGEKGRTTLSTKALLKKVGFAMNLQHLTVSQMALLDKPDSTWESHQLDALYHDLSTDYELEDRYDVLSEKLKLIFHNVQFILDFIDARRSLMLEATIVLLIVFEIVLFFIGVE
jgi:uncharacterized Rmd1/YagE family protein